jgi:hypothetical protein
MVLFTIWSAVLVRVYSFCNDSSNMQGCGSQCLIKCAWISAKCASRTFCVRALWMGDQWTMMGGCHLWGEWSVPRGWVLAGK